jgi:multicomponent Na+:H+ antiporter subunit G
VTAAIDILSSILILVGIVFMLIGGYGILKMPDFITRVHATSLIDSGAVIFILAGLILKAGFTLVAAKLGLVLIFLLLTSPTAIHALMGTALFKDSNLINGEEPPSKT